MSTRYIVVQIIGDTLKLPIADLRNLEVPFGSTRFDGIREIVLNPYSTNPRKFTETSGFAWHLMADGWPEKGKNDYIIMGIKGGLYLAPRFEGYGYTEDTVWFRDTRGNHHHPAQVLAWAVVPPLEVAE